jgi:hypothetical protein
MPQKGSKKAFPECLSAAPPGDCLYHRDFENLLFQGQPLGHEIF